MIKKLTIIIIFVALTLGISVALARQNPLVKKLLFRDANLIHYYRLDGNSGDTMGTAPGQDTNVTYGSQYGVFNQGANYIVTSSSISSSTINSGLNGDFTFTAIVRITSQPGTNALFSLVSSHVVSYNNYWILLYYGDSGGTKKIVCAKYDGTNNPDLTVNTVLANATRYFLTCMRRNSLLHLYINAVDQVPAGVSDNTGAVPGYSGFGIGGEVGRTDRYANAEIDDVAVFSRGLTDSEVSSIYTSRSIEKGGISR